MFSYNVIGMGIFGTSVLEEGGGASFLRLSILATIPLGCNNERFLRIKKKLHGRDRQMDGLRDGR